MAHWIIEDKGFGGTFYTCSECREVWCDIFENVSMEDKCPNCGVPIDEDKTEYIEKKRPFIPPRIYSGEWVKKYSELEQKLINISSFDMEKLVELFAAGYTLQPPTYTGLETFDKGEKSNKTIELKPCPFCGNEAILCKDMKPDGQTSYKVAYVKCQSCGSNTGAYIIDGYYDSKTTVWDPIIAWNKRVKEAK